jgi:hypothetical protein
MLGAVEAGSSGLEFGLGFSNFVLEWSFLVLSDLIFLSFLSAFYCPFGSYDWLAPVAAD